MRKMNFLLDRRAVVAIFVWFMGTSIVTKLVEEPRGPLAGGCYAEVEANVCPAPPGGGIYVAETS